MEFFNGLAELLFSESGTISGDKSFLLGIFASGSTIMGVIVVVLDALIFYSFGKSPVNLTHKGWGSSRNSSNKPSRMLNCWNWVAFNTS
jgi:hypothetical protein